MDKKEILEQATRIANVSSKAIALSLEAINAAMNDDEAAAEAFLAQARDRYQAASDAWDAAGEPTPTTDPAT